MSSPLIKRRRLNDASSRLSRPFVSPLRSVKPEQQTQPKTNSNNAAILSYTPSTLAHSTLNTTPDSKPPDSNVKAGTRKPNAPPSTPARKPPTWISPATTSSRPRKLDPAEQAAAKAITQVEMQIKRVRTDIDTLAQAHKLSAGATDEALEALTLRWKQAAQDASEELFGFVKERVCRMGGVQAWRDAERLQYERAHGLGEFAARLDEGSGAGGGDDDDADCEFDSQGEELPEEEQEYRRREKRRVQRELREAADVDVEAQAEAAGAPKIWQEDGLEDDTFTMDMMLRSLNIELDTIGYDGALQRWVT